MFDKVVSISYCNLSKGIVLQMENFYLLDSLHMNVIVWKFCILQRFNSLVTSLFCLKKKNQQQQQQQQQKTKKTPENDKTYQFFSKTVML